MTTVLCGEKKRHLVVPYGWRKLEPEEEVIIGDKVANIREVRWMDADNDDIGFTAEIVGDHVIRKE